ncbi:MAG: hypothetical protein ACRC13_05365 [Tannerellaceae bacterium]
MGLFFFYQNRKPRKFGHKPIFYDERKEALEERVVKIKKELGEMPEEEFQPTVKGSFVEGTSHIKKKQMRGQTIDSRVSTNIRLAVILILLLILAGYLFF